MNIYESSVVLEYAAKCLKQINMKNIIWCSATHGNVSTTNQNAPLMPVTLFHLLSERTHE
jgi:hypothetical protein